MTVDRRIIDLYNEYVHTALPRRDFLTRLASIAGHNDFVPGFLQGDPQQIAQRFFIIYNKNTNFSLHS